MSPKRDFAARWPDAYEAAITRNETATERKFLQRRRQAVADATGT
jgi:hypothetical protein